MLCSILLIHFDIHYFYNFKIVFKARSVVFNPTDEYQLQILEDEYDAKEHRHEYNRQFLA